MSATTQRDWPGADNDPEGAEFCSFPAGVPAGNWAYIVDDFCVSYAHASRWPFRYTDENTEREVIAGWERKGFTYAEGCGWRSIRLAPDTEYCSAGQNYVTVYPSTEEPLKAWGGIRLYVRPQGMGAIVVPVVFDLDLGTMTGTFRNLSASLPEALKIQAEDKMAKILALLAEHVARRDAGKRKIETAYEHHAKAVTS